MTKIPLKNSLHPLPKDPRDFALGAVFGQMKIEEIPQVAFFVSEPLVIKDQGETDECSAYALTAVSEDQEGMELMPEYQFFKTKQLDGEPEEWGADLRIACKSAVKFGSLPLSGFELNKGLTRSQLLKPEQWPSHADDVAKLHKKETFFTVTGRYDMFDNIRVALYQNRDEKCSVITGAKFRTEWLDAPNGVISEQYGDEGFGHAFKIYGQKVIGGKMYLVAQLSQGAMVGDGGKFYLPRAVVNKEIGPYGVFMFKDMPREEAEFYIQNKVVVSTSVWKTLWSIISNFFK